MDLGVARFWGFFHLFNIGFPPYLWVIIPIPFEAFQGDDEDDQPSNRKKQPWGQQFHTVAKTQPLRAVHIYIYVYIYMYIHMYTYIYAYKYIYKLYIYTLYSIYTQQIDLVA